ncbi:MAG: cysteine synthase family protein [Acidimicrobiia bacterium]|jgi:cysteine synthase A
MTDLATRPSSQVLHSSILDSIGGTPLLSLNGVWAKLEYLNPSGSIKARVAHYMIERAEEEGLLAPGDTIVEASSGNTGNAMSMVAAAKGYRMVVVMPRGLSNERVQISRAFGAEVELVGDFHVNEAVLRAYALGRRSGYFCPQQFESEWNIKENETWLGPEILDQLPRGVAPDAFVMGVGTGGTLIGVGRAFRAANPRALTIGLEPDESCTLLCGEVGRHVIEGISDGFVPGIVARNMREVDEFVAVSGDEALNEMHRLASEHGLLVGPSSGAHMVAARRLREQRPELENVVTILCDEGEKYLSEHFVETP